MTAALEANNDNVILAIDAVEASGETGDVDAAEQEIADYNESECAADAGNTDDDDDDDEGILDGGIMEVLPTRLGLSEDDTRCVIETVDFSGGRTPTSTDVFDALEACGIDPLSLTDPE